MISFDGSNWITWITKMEDIHYCQDPYVLIEGKGGRPKGMQDGEWNKFNKKVSFIMFRPKL